jgi:hypothetical protein
MTLEQYEQAKAAHDRDYKKIHVALAKNGYPYVVSCTESDLESYEKRGYEVLERCATIHHARERARQLVPVTEANAIEARRAFVRAKYPAGARITDKADIAAIYGKNLSRGVTREDGTI